jgi:hypothetical protein
MIWWCVASGAHKSKFLCQQPSFLCLSNRPGFLLKDIVLLGYERAGGVCDATDRGRTDGETAKHCRPIRLYEFLIFLDVSYNFYVPLKGKRVHCVILIH